MERVGSPNNCKKHRLVVEGNYPFAEGNTPISCEKRRRCTDLGTTHLVGIGAVGSAAIYALSTLPQLAGTLHLIDNDKVDDSNLQR